MGLAHKNKKAYPKGYAFLLGGVGEIEAQSFALLALRRFGKTPMTSSNLS